MRVVGEAQLVERSLPTTEVYSSNPFIVQFYINCQLYRKDESEEIDAGNGHAFKDVMGV